MRLKADEYKAHSHTSQSQSQSQTALLTVEDMLDSLPDSNHYHEGNIIFQSQYFLCEGKLPVNITDRCQYDYFRVVNYLLNKILANQSHL